MSYFKTKSGSLEEAIKKHDEDYQALFKKELEKSGKSIPQMTPDEKKEVKKWFATHVATLARKGNTLSEEALEIAKNLGIYTGK